MCEKDFVLDTKLESLLFEESLNFRNPIELISTLFTEFLSICILKVLASLPIGRKVQWR